MVSPTRHDGVEATYVVVGGGVSGLAAARLLSGLPALGVGPGGASAQGVRRVVLLEATDRLGGKVLTAELPFATVELGPDQFLRREPAAEAWCRELGLADRLVEPAGRTAGLLSRGSLRGLPAGLVLGVPTDLAAVEASGILSEEGLHRARLDAEGAASPLGRRQLGLAEGETDGGAGTAEPELSAGAILRERLGDEVVDRLVDPLLGGINAGSVDSLSLATVAPTIARALVGARSVTAALRPLAPSRRTPGDGTAVAASPTPFYGLSGGLGQLVDAAAAQLAVRGVDVRLGTAVEAVETPTETVGRVLLRGGGEIEAAGVVLAVPADKAALLLRPSMPTAAATLGEIPAASVAVVTFAFARRPELPAGWTGFLVPRVEGRLMTAATFLSEKWPWTLEQAGGLDRGCLIRVSAGRFGDDRPGELDDAELSGRLAGELGEVLGMAVPPVGSHVHRWVRAFPQYAPGHAARIRRLEAELARRPLAIAGALRGGIGVPACIASGEQAAARLLALTTADDV